MAAVDGCHSVVATGSRPQRFSVKPPRLNHLISANLRSKRLLDAPHGPNPLDELLHSSTRGMPILALN